MIGIFDSGYGGLTVLREIFRVLPEYDYCYFGDNARTPYGTRSDETITRFTGEIIAYMQGRHIPLLICACNTASSVALPRLGGDSSVIGIIDPIVEYAAKVSQKGIIGVVGTRATVHSGAYETALKNLRPDCKVYSQACPLLVPLIEENYHTRPEAKKILRNYVRPLKHAHVDTLILGCTHYPIMYKDFKRTMGSRVNVIDSGKIMAAYLKNFLADHPAMEKKLSKNGKRLFLTTDDPERFKNHEFAKKLLKLDIDTIEKVTI